MTCLCDELIEENVSNFHEKFVSQTRCPMIHKSDCEAADEVN